VCVPRNSISIVPAFAISLISAPAANDFSLPVNTMQRIDGSSPISVRCFANSLRTSRFNALARVGTVDADKAHAVGGALGQNNRTSHDVSLNLR
jgi:hypothetical protein